MLKLKDENVCNRLTGYVGLENVNLHMKIQVKKSQKRVLEKENSYILERRKNVEIYKLFIAVFLFYDEHEDVIVNY